MSEETPKPPSGAANRRKRYERLEAAAASDVPDDGKWARDFQKAGKPDLENPDTDLSYVRKLQMIALRQMATTPFPSIAQQGTWRRIREMSAVVGMTSNRASLEARVKKLQKSLGERQQVSTIIEVPGSSITKPDTARGGSKGPRPIPEDPLVQ